jgi:hypothetical protein
MRDEEVKALLASGLSGEPPVRISIDEVVAAGHRRRSRRRMTLASGGLSLAAAAVFGLLMLPGAEPASGSGHTGDPLVGPLVPVGQDGAVTAQGVRPDAVPGGTEHTSGWTGGKLGETLVTLLPGGKATALEGDIPGRTYRVTWTPTNGGAIDIVGGADRTAEAPQVPLCAKVVMPDHPSRPGAPSTEDASALQSCETLDLDGGGKAEALTLRSPDGRRVSHYVRAVRADGRTVTIQMWNGHGDGDRWVTSTPEPPLGTAELVRIANDAAWRF